MNKAAFLARLNVADPVAVDAAGEKLYPGMFTMKDDVPYTREQKDETRRLVRSILEAALPYIELNVRQVVCYEISTMHLDNASSDYSRGFNAGLEWIRQMQKDEVRRLRYGDRYQPYRNRKPTKSV